MKRVRALTLAVIVAGFALRLAHWGAPLTSDEGYMLRAYVGGSASFIATTYDAPNNHVLLSLMLHGIDAVWPKKLVLSLAGHRPLQAPSLAAAGASLWLLSETAAALAGPVAALFAVVALAFSYWHLMYSNMLRGYSLSTGLELCALWLALLALRRRRAWPLFLAAAAAAAAHYVVPSNAVFTAAAAVAVLWLRHLRPTAPPKAKGKSKTASAPPLRAAWLVAAAGVCAALTVAAYWPILGLVLARSGAVVGVGETIAQIPARFGAAGEILGFGPFWAAAFAALALGGVAGALGGGRRSRGAAGVVLAFLLAPPLIFKAQRVTAPARVYLPALPMWCLALGLAGRQAAAALSRRVRSRRLSRWAAPALALGAAAAFSTQAAPFLRWNRGLDPRKTLAALAGETRSSDDFMVLVAEHGDDDRFGELNWEYYAFSASLEPYFCMSMDRDLAYQSRARYIVLAKDEESALRALEKSGVDEFMRGALKLTRREGRLGVYETSRDEEVLKRYRAAPAKAAALAGLGVQALSSGEFGAARSYLVKAKGLAPDDEKIRYQLARVYYLAFDETKAEAEFQWVVERDTGNAHAPFYLADAQAQLGKNADALKWFQWYFDSGRPAQGWIFKDVAKLGLAAVRQGKAAVPLAGNTADGWLRVAMGNYYKGAFSRTIVALERSVALRPSEEAIVRLASLHAMVHEYAASAKILRALLARGASEDLRVPLARVLRNKDDFDGAGEELAKYLKAHPDDSGALAFAEEVRRLRD